MPSYRDDFYIPENIIGYTGDLNDNPTVYFKSGPEFGRITQYHRHEDNIGRNEVRLAYDYRIINDESEGKAYEFYDGFYRHKSRHQFIEVSHTNRYLLGLAISKFKDQKSKSVK